MGKVRTPDRISWEATMPRRKYDASVVSPCEYDLLQSRDLHVWRRVARRDHSEQLRRFVVGRTSVLTLVFGREEFSYSFKWIDRFYDYDDSPGWICSYPDIRTKHVYQYFVPQNDNLRMYYRVSRTSTQPRPSFHARAQAD
jgi:hypothetical protein